MAIVPGCPKQILNNIFIQKKKKKRRNHLPAAPPLNRLKNMLPSPCSSLVYYNKIMMISNTNWQNNYGKFTFKDIT